ncbi:hypothetical protein LXA43DRAFT_44101 [Ganoderma leucocontextum]|nr:hypothetical protein LXA43DRAFT_44101 [Ganoderma leucocontextum]
MCSARTPENADPLLFLPTRRSAAVYSQTAGRRQLPTQQRGSGVVAECESTATMFITSHSAQLFSHPTIIFYRVDCPQISITASIRELQPRDTLGGAPGSDVSSTTSPVAQKPRCCRQRMTRSREPDLLPIYSPCILYQLGHRPTAMTCWQSNGAHRVHSSTGAQGGTQRLGSCTPRTSIWSTTDVLYLPAANRVDADKYRKCWKDGWSFIGKRTMRFLLPTTCKNELNICAHESSDFVGLSLTITFPRQCLSAPTSRRPDSAVLGR